EVKAVLLALRDSAGDSGRIELEPDLKRAIQAAESLLRDAQAAQDTVLQKQYADRAREKMNLWISCTGKDSAADCYVWRTSGRIAVAQADPELAAFTVHAVETMRKKTTGWKSLQAALDECDFDPLLLELNKLAIDDKVVAIRSAWGGFYGGDSL